MDFDDGILLHRLNSLLKSLPSLCWPETRTAPCSLQGLGLVEVTAFQVLSPLPDVRFVPCAHGAVQMLGSPYKFPGSLLTAT